MRTPIDRLQSGIPTHPLVAGQFLEAVQKRHHEGKQSFLPRFDRAHSHPSSPRCSSVTSSGSDSNESGAMYPVHEHSMQ